MFGFGGQKFIVLRTLWTTEQSIHPNAANVQRSRWKWTDNRFDRALHWDKAVKKQLFRQISATRKCCERISTWQYNLTALRKCNRFDRVVQPEKVVRFFFESTCWKSKILRNFERWKERAVIVTDRGEAVRKRQVEFPRALQQIGQICVVQWAEFGLNRQNESNEWVGKMGCF